MAHCVCAEHLLRYPIIVRKYTHTFKQTPHALLILFFDVVLGTLEKNERKKDRETIQQQKTTSKHHNNRNDDQYVLTGPGAGP